MGTTPSSRRLRSGDGNPEEHDENQHQHASNNNSFRRRNHDHSNRSQPNSNHNYTETHYHGHTHEDSNMAYSTMDRDIREVVSSSRNLGEAAATRSSARPTGGADDSNNFGASFLGEEETFQMTSTVENRPSTLHMGRRPQHTRLDSSSARDLFTWDQSPLNHLVDDDVATDDINGGQLDASDIGQTSTAPALLDSTVNMDTDEIVHNLASAPTTYDCLTSRYQRNVQEHHEEVKEFEPVLSQNYEWMGRSLETLIVGHKHPCPILAKEYGEQNNNSLNHSSSSSSSERRQPFDTRNPNYQIRNNKYPGQYSPGLSYRDSYETATTRERSNGDIGGPNVTLSLLAREITGKPKSQRATHNADRLNDIGGRSLFSALDKPSGGMPSEVKLLKNTIQHGNWAETQILVSRLAPRLIGDPQQQQQQSQQNQNRQDAAMRSDPNLPASASPFHAGGGRLGFEREAFIMSGGVEVLISVFKTEAFIGAPNVKDARELSREMVTTKLSGCWNEIFASLRELAYALPELVDNGTLLDGGDFLPFLFTLLAHDSCFDGAATLIEEILSFQSKAPPTSSTSSTTDGPNGEVKIPPLGHVTPASTFYLGNVPNLYELWGNFSCRQLAHFCRILALLVFEPEDRQLLESPAVLKSLELLQLRRDRAARAGRDAAVDMNQAILLGDDELIRKLLKLLKVMNFAPSLKRSSAYHVIAHFPWIADTLVMLGLSEFEDWSEIDRLEPLARKMLPCDDCVPNGDNQENDENDYESISDLGSIVDMLENLSGLLFGSTLEPTTQLGHIIHVINAVQQAGVVVGRQRRSRRTRRRHDSNGENNNDIHSNGDSNSNSNPFSTSVNMSTGSNAENYSSGPVSMSDQVLLRRLFTNSVAVNGDSSEDEHLIGVGVGVDGVPGEPTEHHLHTGTTRGLPRIESPEDAANELQFNSLLLAPYQVEVLFVLCVLLGGRRKIDSQRKLKEFGLIATLDEMFYRLSWGTNSTTPRRQQRPSSDSGDSSNRSGETVDSSQIDEEVPTGIHGPGCECNPESVLRVQYLRLLHNFCDRDCDNYDARRLLLSQEERNFIFSDKFHRDATSGQNLEPGLLSKILKAFIHESDDSPYRFWLASCAESYLRGSAPQEQLFAAQSGLLEHLVKDVMSDRLHCAGSLQTAFDLLGELCKGNADVLHLLLRGLDEEGFRRLMSVAVANLVDSNVFIRSLFLSVERIAASRQVQHLHIDSNCSEGHGNDGETEALDASSDQSMLNWTSESGTTSRAYLSHSWWDSVPIQLTPELNEEQGITQFSPSRDVKGDGNLHGLALMLAVDRAKRLSRCGQRCANLLYDIEGVYDVYASALQKICQSLTSTSAFASTPVQPQISVVNKSLVSFSKQIQGLVICIRGSIARPLHGSMGSMGDTAPSIYNRYTKTRFGSYNKRKNALQMRAKYVKAVRDAETVIQSLQESSDGNTNQGENPYSTETSTKDLVEQKQMRKAWENSLKKIGIKQDATTGSADQMIQLLNTVQSYEAQYRQLVKEENKAVDQSQRMEVMALEAIQDLEEERLHFFLEMMGRTLEAEKGALDKMTLSTMEEASGEELEAQKEKVPSEEKEKKANVFTDLFMLPSSGPNEEERVGFMESETLGLPEEVGLLRDDVRSYLLRRTKRLQAARALSSFFEDIAAATVTLASGVKNRLRQDGYDASNAQNPNTLAVAFSKYEGQRVLSLWGGIITEIEDGSASAKQLAETIRSLRQQKLDPIVLQSDKDIKSLTEADDSRWKYLCETARAETKADNRYKQTAAQFEKARSRIKSCDSTGEQVATTNTPGKALKPGMSKALGNMMAILPNGGEHAMKIMTPGAKMAIANSTYEEANKKELKDKQALEAATEAKTRALEKYTKDAQEILYECQKDDNEGWNDLRLSLKLFISALVVYRQSRSQSIEEPSVTLQKTGNISKLKDTIEWTERVKSHVARKKAEGGEQKSMLTGTPGKFTRRQREINEGSIGFKLDVQLEDSKSLYKVISFVRDNEGETGSEDASSEPTSGNPEAPPEGKPLNEQPRSHSTGDIQDKDDDETPTVSISFRKSQTMPYSPQTQQLKALAETLKDHSEIEGNQKVMMPPPAPFKGDSTKETPNKPETEVFLMHFWSDKDEGEAPTIIESFSCAYWPKGNEATLSPLLHGRMFVTSKTMYFVGWGGKKIVLDWKDAVNVTKEKNMMGTIDNALRIAYNSDEGESSYFFGSFASREEAYQLSTRLTAVATALVEMGEGDEKTKTASSAPDIPPDTVIKTKMETILSKRIKNCSIQQFYEIVWSEGNRTNQKPFYGPWLEEQGSMNVAVGEWEFSEEGASSFENEWCGEKFHQKRTVDFEFERTTHLYIGPPIAGVHQTQYCRVEGNDKCVLAISVAMSGIPYADTFAVECRWVARRVGSNDIAVDVGVYVNFKKSNMFAAKIRSGTTTETKPVHLKLFESARKACAAAGGEEGAIEEESEEEVEEEEIPEKKPHEIIIDFFTQQIKDVIQNPQENTEKLTFVAVVLLSLVFRYLFGYGRQSGVAQQEPIPRSLDTETLEQKVEDLTAEVQKIRLALEQMLVVMKENSNAGSISSSCDAS